MKWTPKQKKLPLKQKNQRQPDFLKARNRN